MADTKSFELDPLPETPHDNDVFFVVDVSDTGVGEAQDANGKSKKVTKKNLVGIDPAPFKVLTQGDPQALWQENDTALLNAQSTGIRYGGGITDLGAGVIRIAAGAGQILNNTDPAAPTYASVVWAETDVDLSATPGVSYIYVDASGAVLSTNIPPDHADYKLNIFLHRVSMSGGVFSASSSIVVSSQQIAGQLYSLFDALGSIKEGLSLSAASTDLSLAVSVGKLYAMGSNFYTDPLMPNQVSYPLKSPATFRMVNQNGVQSADTTQLDVANYDLAGAITPVPGASSRAQIMTVMMFPGSGGNIRIFYGQSFFSNIEEASQALREGLYAPVMPSAYVNASRLGWVIVEKGATDLSNGTQILVTANRFGDVGGSISTAGAGSLLSINNLSDVQDAETSRLNIKAVGSDVAPAAGAAALANILSLTQASYDALTPAADTLYIVTDTSKIYLGTTIIANAA